MKTTVNWNEELYNTFCKLAMLPKRERDVLRLRIMEESNTEIAEITGYSTSTVIRIVNKLRKKYDKVQPLSNGTLPVRKMSEKEKWMDEN